MAAPEPCIKRGTFHWHSDPKQQAQCWGSYKTDADRFHDHLDQCTHAHNGVLKGSDAKMALNIPPQGWKSTLITSPEKLARQANKLSQRILVDRRETSIQLPYILEPLHAEYREGRLYQLMKQFVYLSAIVGKITVPEGFLTDFHSIPRWLWAWLPFDDWAEAATAHDFLCTMHASDVRPISSVEAHNTHYECLRHIGAPEFRAQVMHHSLLVFGPKWKM